MKTADVFKKLEQIPWLIVFGIVLLGNTLLNYTDNHLYGSIPNAITQVVFFFVLGYSLYRNRKKEQDSSFNVFMMSGVFLLSTLLVWFNAGAEMLMASAWILLSVQLILAGITLTHMKDIKALGTGVTWFYAALIFVLVFVVAGVWVNYLHLGWSQSLLWNFSIRLTCVAYLVRKGSKSLFGVLALASVVIAVFAAFGFSGQAISLFPL